MSEHHGLTEEQKNFLQGFAMGADVARAVRGLPILSGSGSAAGDGRPPRPAGATVDPPPRGPERLQIEAQNRVLAEGKTLCKEETGQARQGPARHVGRDPGQRPRRASSPRTPMSSSTSIPGLFYVAPAQNAFMCRLRIPGGVMPSWQFRGVADLARRFGGGYADVTTRANLQIREIGPHDAPDVLTGLTELGHRQPRGRGRQHPQRHRQPDQRHRPAGADRDPAAGQGDAPLHPEPSRDVRPAAQVQHRLRRRRPDRQPRRHQRHRLQGRPRPRGQRRRRAVRRASTSG